MSKNLTNKELDAWKIANGATLRTWIEVKDVKLANGTILPNRHLRRDVWDLADGRTVKIQGVVAYDGVSNRNTYLNEIIEAGA